MSAELLRKMSDALEEGLTLVMAQEEVIDALSTLQETVVALDDIRQALTSELAAVKRDLALERRRTVIDEAREGSLLAEIGRQKALSQRLASRVKRLEGAASAIDDNRVSDGAFRERIRKALRR